MTTNTMKQEDEEAVSSSKLSFHDPTFGGPVRQMEWEDKRMLGKLLLQCYGSVWPSVLPYCIANVLWTIVVAYLYKTDQLNLTVDATGHKYMAALMSFLVVTRVKIIYDRYMTNSQLLSNCYKAIRELAQNVCILTARDHSVRAKQWRNDVLYHAIVLLRVTMAVLEFKSHEEGIVINATDYYQPWDVPELSFDLQAQIKECMFLKTTSSRGDESPPNGKLQTARQLAHNANANNNTNNSGFFGFGGSTTTATTSRTALDEACRAVTLLCFETRREIMKQRDGTWLKKGTWDHPCNEETKLLDCVGDFHKAFSSLRVLFTTPMPFPLVQMTKTFLFVWVFFTPLTLAHDDAYSMYTLCGLVFLITFGFFGLEYVAMELSDVFGDDPSDFDDLGHAQTAFEDCYISIYKLDGPLWARKLRRSVMGRHRRRQRQRKQQQQGGYDDGNNNNNNHIVDNTDYDSMDDDIAKEIAMEQKQEAQELLQFQQQQAAAVAAAEDDAASRGSSKKKKNRVSKLLHFGKKK